MIRNRLLGTLSLLCLWAVSAYAQLSSGYYRVQNTQTGRYITIVNNTIGGTTTNPDLSALTTVKGFDNVVSNPASILYFRSLGNNQFDMVAQGVDTYELTGYHFTITGSGDIYQISASAGILSFSLSDATGGGDTGEANISGSAKSWKFIPVTTSDGQYFGFKPEYQVGNKYYTSCFATYSFEPVSSGMKFYVVEKSETNVAIIKEHTGAIAPYTPIIVECASASPANNKIKVLNSTPSEISDNQLSGNLFNKTSGNLRNQTAYKSATMRMLGLTGDGKIGMVKSNISTLPANKVYLTVSTKASDELPLMTNSEYNEATEQPVTIIAKNAVRYYGENNPNFEYTVEGGTPIGAPTLYCDASKLASVGTYPIQIRKGQLKNKNVTMVEGELTVLPAPLQVWASTVTRMQGEPNPDIDLIYIGFKNDDNASVIKVKPTIDYGADESSPAGTYTITMSGGSAKNYEFEYYPATLEVLERQLTAGSYTREYGDPNPTPDYTPKLPMDGEPNVYCNATESSPVGEYDVVIERGTLAGEGIEYVYGKLTITPAPLTIKANDMTRAEGEPNPDFTATYEGFKNGETNEVLTVQPTFVCDADENSKPGTYPIYVKDAGSPNYEITYLAGTLTVTEAPSVTVTATDYIREYGDENPEFGFTSQGATIYGTPDINCEATSSSPVGTYPIVISKGGVTNRNDTYVNGTLTITKAPLTISGGEYSIKQGDELPEFIAVYQGFKNNETEAVLKQMPMLETTAMKGSEPGIYEVTVSGAEADNYEITYVSGTLTISEADPVVVTATSITREYGDENPTLEYTVEGATLEGYPELMCMATATSPVGTYDIIVSKGNVANYNDIYVNGTLTIMPATLTVGVNDAEIEQGDELPVFELTYQGWKNADDLSVLTALPVASTTATGDSEVGEYEISISGGEAQNYVFNYVPGKLTVKESSGISTLLADDGNSFDVYTTKGMKVRSRVTSLDGLPKGVYIVKIGSKIIKLKK